MSNDQFWDFHEEVDTKAFENTSGWYLSGVCAGGGHPQRLPHAPAGRQQDRPQRRPAPAQVLFSAQTHICISTSLTCKKHSV